MNSKTCSQKFKDETHALNKSGSVFCPAVFDQILCWGPSMNNDNVSQACPDGKGLDPTKFAYRTCNSDGTWFNKNDSNLIETGYSNYSQCLKPILKDLLQMCERIGVKTCYRIVDVTRLIEMVGLSLSLVALILSLVIFYKYRILRNNRTTIHKNLFIATVFQVLMRIIIYSDEHFQNIEKIPYLSETCYVLLEFSKTATIMWMFIEGLSLHNAMTITVFREYSFIKIYCYVGWLVSTFLTIVWVISMVFSETEPYWYVYHFQANYWILEGPTSALIVINMLFLLNIIRILVLKLRDSNMGEIEQIRKAVRAAILLVPLMGTVNILFMIDYRIFESAWKFALWSFTTHFFTSFQGFFIATLYCFMNGEVRDVVKNNFSLYMSLRTGGCGGGANHIRHSGEVTRLSSVDPEDKCMTNNMHRTN